MFFWLFICVYILQSHIKQESFDSSKISTVQKKLSPSVAWKDFLCSVFTKSERFSTVNCGYHNLYLDTSFWNTNFGAEYFSKQHAVFAEGHPYASVAFGKILLEEKLWDFSSFCVNDENFHKARKLRQQASAAFTGTLHPQRGGICMVMLVHAC